jgi:hypothetical protein
MWKNALQWLRYGLIGIILFIASFVTLLFWMHRERLIANDIYFSYLNGDGHLYYIDRPSELTISLVDPDVSWYQLKGKYIVGERLQSRPLDSNLQKYGFFIVNVETRQLAEGLNKIQFDAELITRNIAK